MPHVTGANVHGGTTNPRTLIVKIKPHVYMITRYIEIIQELNTDMDFDVVTKVERNGTNDEWCAASKGIW